MRAISSSASSISSSVKSVRRYSNEFDTAMFKSIDFRTITPRSLLRVLSGVPEVISCYVGSQSEREKFEEVGAALYEYLHINGSGAYELSEDEKFAFTSAWLGAKEEWKKLFGTEE